MSSIINEEIEFVRRTKMLLESNYERITEDNLEFTFLLNCLLGLIVFVSENNKNPINIIDNEFINYLPDAFGFTSNPITDIDLTDLNSTQILFQIYHKNDLISQEKTKKWFISKLRNGIAHNNIEAINTEGKWTGLRLWNSNWNKVKDFEIIFTAEELKSLAIKISADYLTQFSS